MTRIGTWLRDAAPAVLRDSLGLAGVAAIVAGVATFSAGAAAIVGGAMLVAASVAWARRG